MVGKILKYLVIAFFFSSLLSTSAYAKRKKTVGDILRKIEKVKIKKKKTFLPESSKYLAPKGKVNLRSVKPPASNRFYYDEGTSEQELEKITDEQINHLYGMTQKFSKSKRRGELWVRLAELYVDKAKLIELRLQTDYDNKLKLKSEGKIKSVPKLNLKPAEAYNKKSIQLYEYFVRDFPKDPKMDQALFFLGYNYFEIGKKKAGTKKYEQLTKRFPKSPYVDESNFALGEYYFEREKWKSAKKHYDQISKNKRSRLYSFALYKTAWCKYKTGRTKSGLKDLERVIYEGRKAKGGSGAGGKVSQIRLASEAAKDIVVFYPEVYKAQNARSYFTRVLGEKSTDKMLGKLAFYYVDKGNKSSAKYIFKQLISADPFSVKAYEYQHEIVKMYQAAGNQKVFKKELFAWIEDYGPGSLWRKENKSKKKLIADSDKLIESTLRNYILQLHQTAQNSRAKYSQKLAKDGYDMYFSSIKDKTHADQMNFFNGELLFDMQDYVGAAKSYNKVVATGNKKGKYYNQSLLNSVLSLEKKIPSASEVQKIVGKSKEPVPFTTNLKSFEKATLKYLSENDKGGDTVAIRYRLGSLYYYFRQYDKALPTLNKIIKDNPKDKHAQYSVNQILDIYNKKEDFVGLSSVSNQLLKVPGLSKAAVAKITKVKGDADYQVTEKAIAGKDPLAAADELMKFIQKNPKSNHLTLSKFNAAVNYEKAGKMNKAIGLYNDVMNSRVSAAKDKDLKKKARKFLAFLYERTGQYAKAAGMFEGFAKKFPKDPDSTSYHFNAAVIYNALDFYTSSIRNYTIFQKRSKGSERNDVNYTIAKMWDRRKKYPSKAIAYYDKFLKGPTKNPASRIEAAYSIARIHDKLRRKSLSEKWYKKVIYRQKKAGVGASYAAEAKFKLIERNDFKAFKNIKIPANSAKMAGAVQKKLGLLNKLQEKLKLVVAYDDAYQIVAALALQGEAQNHMADSIYRAPIPRSLKGEQVKQYKAGIDKLAKPFKDQALVSLDASIKKAYDLQVYDKNVLKALSLRDKIKPQPMVNEMKVLKSLWLSRAGI